LKRWLNTRSLLVRLLGVSLMLMLAVQLAAFTLVRSSIETNARTQIAKELDIDERVWRRLLEQNAERLRQGSSLLLADYGFRSAVASDDMETIQSALENNGERIGAQIAAFLNTELKVVAISDASGSASTQGTLSRLLPKMTGQTQVSQIAVVGDKAYQFVLVPMKAPVVIGWVLMGFPLGQNLVDEMQRLLSSDVALTVQSPDGAMTIPVSTLNESVLTQLRNQRGPVSELKTPKDVLLVRESTLTSVNGQVSALLLRSVDTVVAPYNRLQVLLALITVAGMVIFSVGSGLMARHVIHLFAPLVVGTRRISSGDYKVPMAHTERRDEVGSFARSFDRMRQDIGKQQAEILHLAYWDRLTGLPNRVRFRDALQQAIVSSKERASPLAVITLNIDRFKHVNDVLGYSFGDQLLQSVAERLRATVPSANDLVARLGGDEFTVLLLDSDANRAMAVARDIRKSFEVPLAFESQTVDLSASMGIACWPDDANDADTLMSRSGIAMYVAKRKLDSPLLYSPAFDSASSQTLSLLTELRRAVEHGELRLFLQPKVQLGSGPVLAAEALVRWQHPTRGLVPPMDFIPFAEQTGFVRQLTLWMFEQTAILLADPRAQRLALRVSINLSTRDLLDPELSLRLGTILLRYKLSAGSFCLEITESAIMDDPQRAEAMLNKLSQQGFKLSIDDFGTGYSSLAYLKRLPVDELKIDKSFVMGMEANEDDAMIVRSTVDLAHNLGLSVVAEGVENKLVMDQLRLLKCDEAQGYHISRPLGVEAFLSWQFAQIDEPTPESP
jgi:diguanylate cyclase (GGDEF)-like protein